MARADRDALPVQDLRDVVRVDALHVERDDPGPLLRRRAVQLDPRHVAEALERVGDEVAIYVAFGEDGETIDEVKFSGRGCAISQAATSMLMEMVKGRSAAEVADMSRDELLEEVGIPLTPVRLKCALLGLGVLKVALHRALGTPLPEEWAGIDDLEFT